MASMVATLLLMLTAERTWPARQFPFYRGWIWIGIGVMVFFVALANIWSLVVPKEWLREHRLFDGEPLGVAGGIMVWYVINTFVTYWYHRFQHRFSFRIRYIRCITVSHGSISPAPFPLTFKDIIFRKY
jgi:sterol desaturase/sphingolipid hydroxylase (fatty acid hydroxylase superfamily)